MLDYANPRRMTNSARKIPPAQWAHHAKKNSNIYLKGGSIEGVQSDIDHLDRIKQIPYLQKPRRQGAINDFDQDVCEYVIH